MLLTRRAVNWIECLKTGSPDRHVFRTMRSERLAKNQHNSNVEAGNLSSCHLERFIKSDSGVLNTKAAGPSPFAVFPWHEAQCFRYVSWPAAALGGFGADLRSFWFCGTVALRSRKQ